MRALSRVLVTLRNHAATMAALLVCVCVLAVPGVLSGQSTSGSIAGVVQDTQGGVIPGAKVTALLTDRGTSVSTYTDAQGRFVFSTLAPGTYSITAEKNGFKKFERNRVVLNANDRLSSGVFKLQIGNVSQTVQVQAAGQMLKTESGERSDVIEGKQLQNTLVNGRSYLALTALTPGVVNNNNYQVAGHGGLGGMSVNGSRTNQTNLTLDGVGDVDTGNNGDQLATVSMDAVQEYKILTSNYQAEYGRSSGAQISVVTKSGTSQFHGEGFEYLRNEALNANNWKNNRDGLQRNKYRYNDYGYNIGGPIFWPGGFNSHKDKLFFFWSQEFQRQLQPQGSRNQTVPTALERKGDFSQSLDKNGNPFPYIKDPNSPNPCDKSDTSGCFADGGVLGRIPQNRLDPNGLAILNAYPMPNVQQGVNGVKDYNFTSQISSNYPRREDMIRVDYNISDNWKMFARYINNADAVTSAYGSFVLGTSIPKVPITDARPGRALAINLTTIINPTTTNEFTFGFGHNQINIDPVNDGLTRKANNLSNLPVLYPNAIKNDFIPNFGFNGSRLNGTGSFGTSDAPFFNYNTSIDTIDNFSKIEGQHFLKAGIYFQRSRKDQTSFAAANGSYDFADNPSNPYDSGFGFANAALGVYNAFSQASTYATGRYRYSNVEFYLQDTWKITPRLTLDYGVREYWIQPQYDAGLQTSTFDPASFDPTKAPRLYMPCQTTPGGPRQACDQQTGQVLGAYAIGDIVPNSGDLTNGILQAGKGINKYLMEDRGLHTGPRFGFAYDVTGKQDLVVRGGAGVFFDRYQGNEVFSMIQNPPTTFSPTLNYGYMNQINPANALLGPSSLVGFSYDGHVPTTYNYSLGIETKLPKQVVLDVAYVGSESRHLIENLNLNAIPYGATFQPANQDPTRSGSAPLGTYALPSAFLRPHRGYGDIRQIQFGSTSNYNSLQASAQRRFGSSLFFTVAYTWSRALGTVSSDGGWFRIDNLTRQANYGPLDFDVNQNLVVNYIYSLPKFAGWVGAGNNWAAKTVLNDWQLSGITRFQSGTPYSVGFSVPGYGSPQITGSYTEGPRVKLVGDPLSGTSDSPYNRLNPNAFTVPAVGSIGTDAPVNYLRRPGFANWDISLAKRFPIRESVDLEFRADAFNAFNHTEFSGINSGLNIAASTYTTGTPVYTNLPYDASGNLVNKNGFGTVSGARDPRIMMLSMKLTF